ncbi:MAG: hypothetical protein K0R17_3703, partial [Rariglobus sp.]|nr:hypothetical protein [Rariglobus sp.]
MAGVVGVEAGGEFHDGAEIDEPLGQEGMGAGEAEKLVSGGLGAGATGPIAGAVIAAVDAVAVAAGNVTAEADEITGGELGDALADGFDGGADLVEDDGGPGFDAGQSDLVDDHVGLADGRAAGAKENLSGAGGG